MVARAEADDLLDTFSNLPVRAEDGELIGTRTEGLLRSTPVSLIQPRIRTNGLSRRAIALTKRNKKPSPAPPSVRRKRGSKNAV